MPSIERTAYPRFRGVVPVRELHEVYEPGLDEVAWARGLARSKEHLLALVVLLKCFQRLGYFPKLDDVPEVIVAHVRSCLGLEDQVRAAHDSDRTLSRHREFVRRRLGVVYEADRARAIAEAAIRTEAEVKDNPADLINVALEELIWARCELPGYSTLDELAARIRAEVNSAIFHGIGERMTDSDRQRLEGLLEVDPRTRRSDFDRLKQPARAATLTRFREHLAYLAWADSLGTSESWLDQVSPTKVAHFAGEARVLDAADLGKVGEQKRIALIACLLHTAGAGLGMRSWACSASAWQPSTSGARRSSRRSESATGPRWSGCGTCLATCCTVPGKRWAWRPMRRRRVSQSPIVIDTSGRGS